LLNSKSHLLTPSESPKYALGYDFDGATFTHIDNFVTFEVLLHNFRLEIPVLKKIAEIVHYLDIGGFEPPDAIGIEKVIQGLRSQISNDNQLFGLANYVFDTLLCRFKKRALMIQEKEISLGILVEPVNF